MNAKTTIILSFVFMAIAGLAAVDQFVWKAKRERAKEEESLVFSLGDEKITRIAIKSNGKETIIDCVKDGGCPFSYVGMWNVVSPVQDEGDSSNIGSLLGAVKNLAPVGRVEADKSDWASFGVAEPKQTLELKLLSGETLFLGFGDDSAIGSNRYLRTSRNEKEVYLVASFFPNQLANDVFHWRNKRILRGVETEGVRRFSWNANGNVSLERTPAGWELLQPMRTEANKIMVEGVLNTILYANGKKIISESGVLPPNSKKLTTVELELKDKSKKKVEIFSLASKDAAMRLDSSDIIYAVDPIPFERLKKKPEEFRFQRLMTFDEKNAAKEVTFRFPREKKEIVLERGDLDWKRVRGVEPKDKLSQTRIKDFLDTLAGLDPVRFTRDPAKWKKFRSLADLELTVGKETFRFVLDGRKSALANGDFSGEARIMGENFLKNLPIRLADLYESTNKRVVIQESEEHERNNERGGNDGHAH